MDGKPPADDEDVKHWTDLKEKVKVIRIALPGTYNQVQAPSRKTGAGVRANG